MLLVILPQNIIDMTMKLKFSVIKMPGSFTDVPLCISGNTDGKTMEKNACLSCYKFRTDPIDYYVTQTQIKQIDAWMISG